MAEIKFTFPDAEKNRILDNYAYYYGYKDKVGEGEQNPETKAVFAKRKIIEHVKSVIKDYEIVQAEKNAREDMLSSVEPTIT